MNARHTFGIVVFAWSLLPLASFAQGVTTTSTSASHSVASTNSTYSWSILVVGPATVTTGDLGSCTLQSPPYPNCTYSSGAGTSADPSLYFCSSALTLSDCSEPGVPKALLAGQRNVNTHSHAQLVATLDVDASVTASKYDALTDGLLVIRYLFGLTGASMTTA